MSEFIIGQHVIANDCNTEGYPNFKGVITEIWGNTYKFRVTGNFNSNLSTFWFDKVELDPDFKEKNDQIAGIDIPKVGDMVTVCDRLSSLWSEPRLLTSTDFSSNYPYRTGRIGWKYAKKVESPNRLTSFDGVKVGTKLKIREDLEKTTGDFEVTKGMAKLAGTIITVKVLYGTYLCCTDNWQWGLNAFEYIVESPTETERFDVPVNDLAYAFDEDMCIGWKVKILNWIKESGSFSFTVDQINEMKAAANEDQLDLINTLFPELNKKSLDDLIDEANEIFRRANEDELKPILEQFIKEHK